MSLTRRLIYGFPLALIVLVLAAEPIRVHFLIPDPLYIRAPAAGPNTPSKKPFASGKN